MYRTEELVVGAANAPTGSSVLYLVCKNPLTLTLSPADGGEGIRRGFSHANGGEGIRQGFSSADGGEGIRQGLQRKRWLRRAPICRMQWNRGNRAG